MASVAASRLLLFSLFFALSSRGTSQQWGPVNIPSTNPTVVYPPAITIPGVFPPPPQFTYPLLPQSWCVARPGTPVAMVQAALDYACGGGADCSAIQPTGSCFIPNTLQDHASYAFNSYYQRNPSLTSCNFGGAAILVSINPSTPTCLYPSTSYQTPTANTYNPMVSYPSPPTVYPNLPTPTVPNPSQPSISNPTGTGAVFNPNNPLGTTPPNSGLTASSSSTSSSAADGRGSTSLLIPVFWVVTVFLSRWQLLGVL